MLKRVLLFATSLYVTIYEVCVCVCILQLYTLIHTHTRAKQLSVS